MANKKQEKTIVKKWSIKKTGIPHKPYHILDENLQIICEVYQGENDLDNAINISLLPQYLDLHKTAKILSDFKDSDKGRKPTHWQDEVYEKHRKEPLAEIFKNNNG